MFLVLCESFRRAALLFPSSGRCIVSGAEIGAAGGGTRRRILTTFMKESRGPAMTSWGNERRPANVPPAESRRWRGKELLIAERRLRFQKRSRAPNGMEINYTRSSIGTEIWIPDIIQSPAAGLLPYSWRACDKIWTSFHLTTSMNNNNKRKWLFSLWNRRLLI